MRNFLRDLRSPSRIRKAITTLVGFAVTLVLLIPEDSVPDSWRPVVGIVLALGTFLGVYAVRNNQPVASRQDLAGRFGPRHAHLDERAERGRRRDVDPPSSIP